MPSASSSRRTWGLKLASYIDGRLRFEILSPDLDEPVSGGNISSVINFLRGSGSGRVSKLFF
jgi:hypothetical protein